MIYSNQQPAAEIDKSIFHADQYQDYEIISAKTQTGGKVTFENYSVSFI